ncbi:MAG: 3'-5' exonuclease [Aerococcus sp.]|nr:3'-5' exonuclease [Aerococcus sp.]
MGSWRDFFSALFQTHPEQQEAAINYQITSTVEKTKYRLEPHRLAALEKEFFVLDLETTGLSAEKDRMVELGVVHYINRKVVDTFNTLINPERSIPRVASNVNHITNDMVKEAPTEAEALHDVQQFLEPVLSGQAFVCAHNANFDMEFLVAALNRQGYTADIHFIDTLTEAKALLKKQTNYKLGTLAEHYHIVNPDPHRAVGDAQTCGALLLKLITAYKRSHKEEIDKFARSIPTSEELEVCAFMYDLVSKVGLPTDLMKFHKHHNKYVTVEYVFPALNFKFLKKGKYLIAPITETSDLELPTAKATMSEGGSLFRRVFFNATTDLLPLKSFITSSYAQSVTKYEEFKVAYANHPALTDQMEAFESFGYQLSPEELPALLKSGAAHPSVFNLSLNLPKEEDINISELPIQPIHQRVPLDKIKNQNSNERAFKTGLPFWEEGESVRKRGDIQEAIQLFDHARYNGLCIPELYTSYALAYRKLKDYDNEIAILTEGIERMELSFDELSQLDGRREKAAMLWLKAKK